MRKSVIITGVILVTVVMMCIVNTFIYEPLRNQKKIQDLVAQEKIQALKERKTLINYFNTNKEQIISSIKTLFLNKEYQKVIVQANKYLIVKNEEIESLCHSAKVWINEIQTKKILAELKIIPVSEYEKNLILYRQLVDLHPTNKNYRNRANFYSRALVPNETGMWGINYYVDDFGEPTKKGYITNTRLIKGTFSNTATQDSRLNVRFLITGSSNISIQLYEYAGNNPVKAYSQNKYTVLVQDSGGNRAKLVAINYSERLKILGCEWLHKALIGGGTIKFRIIEIGTPTTNYKFKIQNADWYDNAYRKLIKTMKGR